MVLPFGNDLKHGPQATNHQVPGHICRNALHRGLSRAGRAGRDHFFHSQVASPVLGQKTLSREWFAILPNHKDRDLETQGDTQPKRKAVAPFWGPDSEKTSPSCNDPSFTSQFLWLFVGLGSGSLHLKWSEPQQPPISLNQSVLLGSGAPIYTPFALLNLGVTSQTV